MTLPVGLRERLAAAIQLQLRHKGLGGSVPEATAMADRALRDANVEALLAHAAAADAACVAFETVADGGAAPGDLEALRGAWLAARDPLAADPFYSGAVSERVEP